MTERRLTDSILAFTPVPLTRSRSDGWQPLRQEQFILALEAMGSVGQAAHAVGMSRASAYKLRERTGAQSFAKAWDLALSMGQTWQWSLAMDRALDGVTTVTVKRGGVVQVEAGHDIKLMSSAIREGRFG